MIQFFWSGNVIEGLFGSTPHNLSVTFMRLYYIGSSHTGGFSPLPGKKALTHNKTSKMESRRVGRH